MTPPDRQIVSDPDPTAIPLPLNCYYSLTTPVPLFVASSIHSVVFERPSLPSFPPSILLKKIVGLFLFLCCPRLLYEIKTKRFFLLPYTDFRFKLCVFFCLSSVAVFFWLVWRMAFKNIYRLYISKPFVGSVNNRRVNWSRSARRSICVADQYSHMYSLHGLRSLLSFSAILFPTCVNEMNGSVCNVFIFSVSWLRTRET
jgi:hypothetical protein